MSLSNILGFIYLSVLCKDVELLKNLVLPAFRCVTVEENIMRQFLKFKEVCVSEIGCRRCVVHARKSEGEDIAKSNEGLVRKEGKTNVKRLVAGTVAFPRFLLRDWLGGQICCKTFSCSGLLPWINARLPRAVTRAANQGDGRVQSKDVLRRKGECYRCGWWELITYMTEEPGAATGRLFHIH